jgi:hypothetical protein
MTDSANRMATAMKQVGLETVATTLRRLAGLTLVFAVVSTICWGIVTSTGSRTIRRREPRSPDTARLLREAGFHLIIIGSATFLGRKLLRLRLR